MRSENIASLILSLGLITLSMACSNLGSKVGNAAVVNNAPITASQFEEAYSQRLKSMPIDDQTVKSEKFKPLIKMFKKMTLETLIMSELIKQEAKKQNLTASPEEVEKVFQLQMAQIGGEKKLTEALNKAGLSIKNLKDELKDQIVRDKLVANLAGNKVLVSESQLQKFYTAHKQEFDTPEQVKARHILIKVTKNEAQDKSKAQDILTQALVSPKNFENLAKKYSQDPGSAVNGGDLGYFSRKMMVPEFSEAAFSTPPGEITGHLVKSQFGYHIIQVEDRKAPHHKTLAEVKPQLSAYLQNQKKSEWLEKWLMQEKEKAKIVILPEYNFDSVKPEKSK